MTTINPFNYSDAAHTPDKGAWVEWTIGDHYTADGTLINSHGASELYVGKNGFPDHMRVNFSDRAFVYRWQPHPHATPSRVSILEDMVEQALPWVADGAYLCRLGTLPPWVSKAGDSVGPPALDKQWTFLRTRLPLSQYVAVDRCGDDAPWGERYDKLQNAFSNVELERNALRINLRAAESESARLRVENERLAKELRQMRDAERETSDAYMRIRQKLTGFGAHDTMPGGPDRFERTEAALDMVLTKLSSTEVALESMNEHGARMEEIRDSLQSQLATVTAQLAEATKASAQEFEEVEITKRQYDAEGVRSASYTDGSTRYFKLVPRASPDRLTTLESRVSALESAAKGVRGV